jgi:acyl-CoA thioester hydrolase
MSRYPDPPPSATTVEIEVPFHDVDYLQVVWHGHYLKYMELARTALLRRIRLDASDLMALRHYFLVAETQVRHQHPLRYADRALVSAWLVEIRSRIRIDYSVANLTSGRASARASTTLVTMNFSTGLCLETPPAILERLTGAFDGPGD